ncbi:MAG: hypothetical protein ABS934_08665 [Psychrobacillus sp.]
MKLYFLNESLGEIDIIEGLYMYGEIIPSINMEKFHDFFSGIMDEESNLEEEKYNEEMLDDKNWFNLNDENNKKEIYILAIYSSNEISWRWR